MKLIDCSALFAAAFLFGCAPRASVPPEQPNPNIHVGIKTLPRAPVQLDLTQFLVMLHTARGRPLTRANAKLQLIMPQMAMGNNNVILKNQEPGIYTGAGRFTMPGIWIMSVSVQRGKARSRENFPISVR